MLERAGADKTQLRRNALDLYAHLRLTAAGPKEVAARRAQQDDPRPKKSLPPYNDQTCLAYAAGLMPSVYAATLHVLKEARKKLLSGEDKWTPSQILDFGSGTASAAW
jgi:ribosomal protein RSM22 (predicted rRNA methylase)